MSSRSEGGHGADAELVALGVGHDHVVVPGIVVVPHDLGSEPG
jgi:hypothetical protein